MEKAFIDISCIIIMVYIALPRLPLMRPHSLSKGFQVVYLFNIVWEQRFVKEWKFNETKGIALTR